MHISLRFFLLLAGLLLAGLVLWQHGILSGGGGKSDGKSSKPVPVTIATVKMGDQPITVSALGTVDADATVAIRPRIDGEIVEIAFKEGAIVKPGDLLFRLDPKPYEAALRQAEADYARDRAQYENARLDHDRAVKLAAKGFLSRQSLDKSQADMKAAAAAAAASKARADIARLDVGYTRITAPIEGKTGPILVDAGNLVRASDNETLVMLRRISPVRINFSLAQQYLPDLQARMQAGDMTITLNPHEAHDTAAPLIATVDFIDNAVDAATGAIAMRASHANLDRRLVPGEFVDLTVTLDTLKSVAILPREAVNLGESMRYVYVVGDDGKVHVQTVDVLFEDAKNAAISGLKAGEKIVTTGQVRLKDGALVSIQGQEASAP